MYLFFSSHHMHVGGVVSFISRSSRHPDQIMGIRSRVVNSKRTDLSKGIRSKIESDALRIKTGSKFGGPVEPPAGSFVKTYGESNLSPRCDHFTHLLTYPLLT